MILKFILPGLITGTMIGAIGVGGILLAPILNTFFGIDLHTATATSSWSFLFTGVAGTLAYMRRGVIRKRPVAWLTLGIIPATLLGAWTNSVLPQEALSVVLAGLIIFSGVNSLYKRNTKESEPTELRNWQWIVIGVMVGFGSSLTGTGGPVLLIPILMFYGTNTLIAVGIGQAIQLPIAIFASIGFTIQGQIDFPLGTMLGIVQAVSVVFGAEIAHKLPATTLKKVVAASLVLVGLFLIAKILI
jgi:uncharacterized protein